MPNNGTLVELLGDMTLTLTNVLYALLGAGLVAFGVLAHAARELLLNNYRTKAARSHDSWEGWEWQPAPRASTGSSRPALYRQDRQASHRKAPSPAAARQPIPVLSRKPQRDKKPEVILDQAAIETAAMAKEVTLVLIANGFDKATAHAAVERVGKSDRESLETWMAAALRACSSGVRGIA